MGGDLLRNSLRLALAAFLTAAIALWFERIMFVWYPLIAVVVTIDDSDDLTMQAAAARMLGTILGGLVTFVVHSVLDGWGGVLVSLLLMLPLLRLLGWEAAIGTASLISLMFLMVPRYSALNWDYVFNRGLDTAVGCLIAILVGLLFWPNNAMERLEREELALKARLHEQLDRYRSWLGDCAERPAPLPSAPFTASLQKLETLMERAQRGPSRSRLLRRRWPERLDLWRGVRHHWLALERLLAALPAPLPAAGQAADGPLLWLITSLEPALAMPAHPPLSVASVAREKSASSSGASPAGREGHPGREGEDHRSRVAGDAEDVMAPAQRAHELLALARSADMPPLLLLAIASEQEAVVRALVALRGLGRC